MSKNHDLGFVSSRTGAAGFRDLTGRLCDRVPLRAAAMDIEGDDDLNEGGAKRRFDCWGLSYLLLWRRVGERPAAGGAERGAAATVVLVVVNGVSLCLGREAGGVYVFVTLVEMIRVSRRGCFAREMSSSKAALLRLLLRSMWKGSMFSESEFSGEGARLFKLWAGLGVTASHGSILILRLKSRVV